MEHRIEPCPFCGHEASVVYDGFDFFTIHVDHDQDCYLFGDLDSMFVDEVSAVETWNMRAQPQTQLGELARFADMLTARGIDHIAEMRGRVVSPEWRRGEVGGWSVICIPYSYGYEEGLLEFWDGKGDPIGWLKAVDALALVEGEVE